MIRSGLGLEGHQKAHNRTRMSSIYMMGGVPLIMRKNLTRGNYGCPDGFDDLFLKYPADCDNI